MTAGDDEPWGWCEHCGDGTEPGDDPAPNLCAMCAKAGRKASAEGARPSWPPPLEHK